MLTDVRRRRIEILEIARSWTGPRGSCDRQTIQDFIQEIGQYRTLRANMQRTEQHHKPS